MEKTSFLYNKDKNGLPLHRYAPHQLKRQIVIDVIEGVKNDEKFDKLVAWEIARQDNEMNKIEAIGSVCTLDFNYSGLWNIWQSLFSKIEMRNLEIKNSEVNK